MDNNRFVIKNSILLTICCFILINLNNIIFFDSQYDNNIAFAWFFYAFIIVILIAIIIITKVFGDDFSDINKFFKIIHGSDNFIEPFQYSGIPIIGIDISEILFCFLPLLFLITGLVNAAFAIKKKKHNLKFPFQKNLVLGILMFSVMFLFFQLIFTSIVNNVTRSQLNTNFNLYMILLLFSLFLYSVIYCVFVKKEKTKKHNKNNKNV